MGNKVIFRLEKLARGQVKHNVQHALREIYCPDADPAKKHLNSQLGAPTYEDFKDQLKAKLKGVRIFRADSPPVIEAFISASPDFFKKNNHAQQKKFFDDAFNYMVKKYGKENILLTTLHRDETSPHMSVFFVPLAVNPEVAEYEAQQRGEPPPPPAKGKKGHRRTKPFTERPPEIALSAKAYINGPRSLAAQQTEFWEKVGKGVGLERGIEGSKARHVKVNDWKKAMAWLEDGMKLPEFEMPELNFVDKFAPGKLEAQIRAAYEKQFGELIQAVKILSADATLKQEKNEETAKRLTAAKKHLAARESDMEAEIQKRLDVEVPRMAKIAVASKQADLDELEQRRAAEAAALAAPPPPDPVPAMKSQLNGALTDRAILGRAFAKTIKQTHNADEMNALADAMGVPAGKGDIFDRLVKSGHAANFEMAVMQVAAYINLDVEGGGRNAVGVASEPRIGL